MCLHHRLINKLACVNFSAVCDDPAAPGRQRLRCWCIATVLPWTETCGSKSLHLMCFAALFSVKCFQTLETLDRRFQAPFSVCSTIIHGLFLRLYDYNNNTLTLECLCWWSIVIDLMLTHLCRPNVDNVSRCIITWENVFLSLLHIYQCEPPFDSELVSQLVSTVTPICLLLCGCVEFSWVVLSKIPSFINYAFLLVTKVFVIGLLWPLMWWVISHLLFRRYWSAEKKFAAGWRLSPQ